MSIAEKLTTIAENEQKVYNAGQQNGFDKGYSDGLTAGEENGRTAEWNELWDGLQSGRSAYGTRSNYDYFAAYGQFIIDKNTDPKWVFKPKYDIRPTSASNMFRELNSSSTGGKLYSNFNIDLAEWLENLGVKCKK